MNTTTGNLLYTISPLTLKKGAGRALSNYLLSQGFTPTGNNGSQTMTWDSDVVTEASKHWLVTDGINYLEIPANEV